MTVRFGLRLCENAARGSLTVARQQHMGNLRGKFSWLDKVISDKQKAQHQALIILISSLVPKMFTALVRL